MTKALTTFLITTFTLFNALHCAAQQEVNCQAVCVLADSVSTSITAAQLSKIKSPRLFFPECDTVRKDAFIRRYTIYCLRETEMLWTRTFSGKNPAFDKPTCDVLKTLNTGDTVYIKDIAVGTNHVDESAAPIKLQVAGDGVVSKKISKKGEGTLIVTRTITLPDAVNGIKKKDMTIARDTALASLLLNKVKTGELKVYPALNFEAGSSLSATEVSKIFNTPYDTVMVEDADGTLIKKEVKKYFDFSSVSSFKVLEEWNPGEENDEDKVVIQGIAPILDYYDDDDHVWAHRPLFWIKYEDAVETIEAFETEHTKISFTKAVWKDFVKAK